MGFENFEIDNEEEEVVDPQNEEEEVVQPQSNDDNAKFAAARRKAEAETKALKDKQDSFAKKYGFNSFEEMEAAQLKEEAEQSRITYEEAGLNPDLINKLIEEHPLIREAKAKIIEEKANQAIKELNSEFDLDVKDINDIVSLPNYDQIYKNLQRGLSLVEAYKLANFNDIAAKKSSAAKQDAINKVNSKSHLKPTGKGVNVDEIEIPPETLKIYKQFFPKWTDKQIKEHYAKESER